jgi:hypothetical protein
MRKITKLQRRLYEYSGAARMRERLRARKRKNAVFIWIPKTAGSSLFTLLDAPKLKSTHLVKYRFPNKGIVTFSHVSYRDLLNENYISEDFHQSAYKFAFVRNPYDRAISLFFYLKRRQMIPQIESFRTFCRRLRDDGCEPIGLYNLEGLSQCNPQVRWVEDIDMNFIGKVESIDTHAEDILKHLGLPVKNVPRKNITAHDKYSKYYCRESKDIVEDFYREDFESFGYAFEDFPVSD